MTYQLKNYSEAYLNEQYEIGNNHLTTWLGAQQSPIDRLRDIYSQADFDPETKFYALNDEEVVGFITAKPINDNSANMEFPLIKPGHEAVEEELMQFAFNTLKNKGISKIISRVSPRWGMTTDYAEKYGYREKELMWKSGRLVVNSYIQPSSNTNSIDVAEADYEEIKKILISFRKNTEKEAQKQLDLLTRIAERVTSWKIVREKDEIIGHDHLVEDIRDNQKARMNAIYSTNDNVRNSIMNAHVQAALASNIEFIDIFFWGPTEKMEAPYLDYGFDIGELFSYEKDL